MIGAIGLKSLLMGMLVLVGVSLTAPAEAASAAARQQFADRVAKTHKLDQAWVRQLLAGAVLKPAVREAYKRPAESKSWAEYRKIFITEKRLKAGRAFMQEHAETFAEAERRFGVPQAVIGAIIGVETFYGVYTGKYRVLDSLVTLAFQKWKRQKFFQRELEEFVRLSAEGHVDPMTIKGSYAGAMGLSQFISSSYRAYAIDFDGDGKRDLLGSPADAIGSVAAYLSRHGWRKGQPVTERVRIPRRFPEAVYKRNKKPRYPIGEARSGGLRVLPALDDRAPIMIVNLQGAQGSERWAVAYNFYVITRYNHSHLYAMAVHQLSEGLAP
ncbi:MAG: lytic murein transglycosylase B [Pseudomonadota bacterium]